MGALKDLSLERALVVLKNNSDPAIKEVRQGLLKLKAAKWWGRYSKNERGERLERALMARSHNPKMPDKDGTTPLHWVGEFGPLAVLKLLSKTPFVDVDAKNKLGETPLFFAAGFGSRVAVEVLLAAKANVHAENMFGKTPQVNNSVVLKKPWHKLRAWLSANRFRK